MNLLVLTAFAMASGGVPLARVDSAPTHQVEQDKPVQLAQVIIRRETIVRIAPTFAPPPRTSQPMKWKEKNAPKCVGMSGLAGLAITRPDAIDLILRGGQRLRAKLEKSCPSVDFYSGFYVKPHKDGRICEDRDTIHSRTGGACEIDKFTLLVPTKAK